MLQWNEVRPVAAGGAILAFAAGAVVIALWDAPDDLSVDGTFVTPAEFPPSETTSSPFNPEMRSTVFEPIAETRLVDVTGVEVPPVSSDSKTVLPNPAEGGDARDTGPFIDPDSEVGDYAYAPVSDVGDFIDPDAY